jgi:tRNA-Thr(GGU) m(6)t(6)A37 methyltransferase TsaA
VTRVESEGTGRTGTIAIEPIGILRTPWRELAEVPRQARLARVRATIELIAGRGLEDAIEDLVGWDYVWVLYWMHRAERWRPKVQPPRSERKRGVLSTRAPHRPNPIGLSPMRIVAIHGLSIDVEECDAIDGTPVIDIKPYVPWADAIPDAKTGWLEPPEGARPGGERPADPRPSWPVEIAERAREQLAWLAENGIDLEARLIHALSLGPQPHAYRRIVEDDRGWRIAVKEWFARFAVVGDRIVVTAITTGVKPKNLARAGEIHRRFVARFG